MSRENAKPWAYDNLELREARAEAEANAVLIAKLHGASNIPERLRAGNLLLRALALVGALKSNEASELARDIEDLIFLIDPSENLVVMREATETTYRETPPCAMYPRTNRGRR